VIGGRVLDATAVAAFARQRSIYLSALVWTATEEDVVLLVPATALVEAGRGLDDDGRAVLDVLLGLPVTVVETLDADRARAVAVLADEYGLDVGSAHAVRSALDRGWSIVTADGDRYRPVAGIEVEEVP
jgi:hypothetical protein